MSLAAVVQLLQTALLLLTLAQGPNVPPALKTQATSIANQAIAAATQALAKPATPSTAVPTTFTPTPAPAPTPAPTPVPTSPPVVPVVSTPQGALTTKRTCVRPGETITLQSGYVRHVVTLCAGSNGTAPITILGDGGTVYGSTKVTDVSSWEKLPNSNVYRLKIGSAVTQVLDKSTATAQWAGWERMPIARSGAPSGSLYSLYTSVQNFGSGGTLRADPDMTKPLQSDVIISKTNSFLVVRTDNWRFVRRGLSSVDWTQGAISFSGGAIISAGGTNLANGFFLANIMPQKAGEWAYGEGYLYLYPVGSGSLAAGAITTTFDIPGENETNAAAVLISINGFTGPLTVSNIKVLGSAGNGITVKSDGNITIDNVRSDFSTGNGIAVYGPTGGSSTIDIRNSTALNAQNNGFAVFGSQVSIEKSYAHANGRLGTAADPLDRLSGIFVGASKTISLADNDIRESGGYGIYVSQAPDGTRITGNTVMTSCYLLNDCSGIYVSSNYVVPKPGATYLISSNNIQTVHVNASGMTGTDARAFRAGIYLDFCASGFTVQNNSIQNASAPGEVLSDVYGLGANTIVQPEDTVSAPEPSSMLCSFLH